MGRRLFPLLLALLATACMVVAHPYPYPESRFLTAQEAVNAATYFARSRGLVVDYTHDLRLDHHARWHVDLGGAGGRDRALVTIDGYSGHVIAARLRGARGELPIEPPPAPMPGQPQAAPPQVGAPPEGPPEGVPPPPAGAPPPPPTG